MSFQRIFLYDLHFLNWKEKNKKFCPEEKSFCLAFGKFQIIFKTELNRIEDVTTLKVKSPLFIIFII